MTCGICNPKAFRPKPGARVYGYCTSETPSEAVSQARRLHYMGAEVVVADRPTGRLADRPGYKTLTLAAVLRSGDRLILSKPEDLGVKPRKAQIHVDALVARGVDVQVLKPDYGDAAA